MSGGRASVALHTKILLCWTERPPKTYTKAQKLDIYRDYLNSSALVGGVVIIPSLVVFDTIRPTFALTLYMKLSF